MSEGAMAEAVPRIWELDLHDGKPRTRTYRQEEAEYWRERELSVVELPKDECIADFKMRTAFRAHMRRLWGTLYPEYQIESFLRAIDPSYERHNGAMNSGWGSTHDSVLRDFKMWGIAWKSALAAQSSGEAKPLFWYRPRSDEGYEGPIHDVVTEQVRKDSGVWVPLFPLAPPAAPAETAAELAAFQKATGCTSAKELLDKVIAEKVAPVSDADPIRQLIAQHAAELENNPYAYFELAYTRYTGWMAWICSNTRDDEPDRKVIAKGQGDTPEEAARAATGES